jgi:uroporphyrinogen-III synthase
LSRPLLLITRPAEEGERTAAAARTAGFDALMAPLLQVEPCEWHLPDTPPQALLFTSARSPALVAAAHPGLRACPAYAVGTRTAEVAREAGFEVIAVGAADASDILRLAAGQGVGRLLHLAGAATAPLEVPPGLQLERRSVYAARRVPQLPDAAAAALAAGRVFAVLLFSARTATHFAALFDAQGLNRATVRLVLLSRAVLAASGPGWRAAAVAPAPSLDGALAAALRLWQGNDDG